MEIFFIIGSAQALFFSILVFNKKNKHISDKILGFWLILFFIHLLFPFFIYREYPNHIDLSGFDAGLFILHGISLYIYARTMTSKEDRLRKSDLWHLLPFFFVNILIIPFITMSNEVKINVYEGKTTLPKIFSLISAIFFIIFITYMVKTILVIEKHKKNIIHEFSFTEKINLRWLSILTISLLIVYCSSIVVGPLLYAFKIPPYKIDYFLYMLLVGFVYCIGYFGYKQGGIFAYQQQVEVSKENSVDPQLLSDDIARPRKVPRRKETSAVEINANDEIFIKKLQRFMEQKKPYLENNLSLYQLATDLNTSPHYLSHILNNVIKKNFYEFINIYRVKEVEKRFHKGDGSKYTLLSIAFESGFNSKASFNRIFKKVSGLTPSQYIKSID